MRPKGSTEELEKRRFEAVRLLKDGYGPTELSRILRVDRRSIQRWHRRFRTSGPNALIGKPHPGRHPRLSMGQRRRLVDLLLEGPKANGFCTDLWSGPRVAQLIRRTFGVRYHPGHLPRLLRSLGWSPQRPERKAYERDERAVNRWLRYDWVRIKKSPPT
jgi:transposase